MAERDNQDRERESEGLTEKWRFVANKLGMATTVRDIMNDKLELAELPKVSKTRIEMRSVVVRWARMK